MAKNKKGIKLYQLIAIIMSSLFIGIFAITNMVRLAYADTTVSSYTTTDDYVDIVVSGGIKDGTLSEIAEGNGFSFVLNTKSGSCSNTPSTATITFYSKKDCAFGFNFDLGGCNAPTRVSISEGSVDAIGENNITIQPFMSGAEYKITITSGETSGDYTVSFFDFSARDASFFNVTFKANTGCEYTVSDGAFSKTITDTDEVVEVCDLNIVSFEVTVGEGYVLESFYIDPDDYSITNSYTLSFTHIFTNACSVEPITNDQVNSPLFHIRNGTNHYYSSNLTLCNAFAVDHNANKITLIKDGILPSGNYTISGGITLLIPFDDDETIYDEDNLPDALYAFKKPEPFKTLTLSVGTSITFSSGSNLCVNSKIGASGQTGTSSGNGVPYGPHGKIIMPKGSSITMSDNTFLYCFGYITGIDSVPSESITIENIDIGDVFANNGSTVWELYQIAGWRGGSATNNIKSWVFPFNQYYVQNIEVRLHLLFGSKEKIYTAVNASSSAWPGESTFISSRSSTSNNDGMFTMQAEGGEIVKYYYWPEDRLKIDIKKYVNFTSLTVDAGFTTVDTKSNNLPIASNIDITLTNGSSVSIAQDIDLLPGANLIIESGANVSVLEDNEVYVYDSMDWGEYARGATCHPLNYVSITNGAPSYTRTISTESSDDSASINVNEQLVVSGHIYTSEHGANIYSSQGTGKIVFDGGDGGNTTLYQPLGTSTSPTKTAIKFVNAKLKNGVHFDSSPSFTETYGKIKLGELTTDTIDLDNSNNSYVYNSTSSSWEWITIEGLTDEVEGDTSKRRIYYFLNDNDVGSLGHAYACNADESVYNSADPGDLMYLYDGDYEYLENTFRVFYVDILKNTYTKIRFHFDKTNSFVFEVPEDGEHEDDPEYGSWGDPTEVKIYYELIYVDDTGNEIEDMPDEYKSYCVGESFTTPPSNALGEGRIIKKWTIFGQIYEPGYTFDRMGALGPQIVEAFEGGWVSDNNGYKYVLRDNTAAMNYASGITRIYEKEKSQSINQLFTVRGGDLAYFNESNKYFAYRPSGYWTSNSKYYSIIQNSSDGEYYYLINGIAQYNAGLIKKSGTSSYYYFGENNFAFKSGYYYVSKTNSLKSNTDNVNVQPGIYYFNNQAQISYPNTISNGVALFSNSIVASSYGLFAKDSNLYYASTNGEILKSASGYITVYVEKTNNCRSGNTVITPGLYCFDSSGRMYRKNGTVLTLISDGKNMTE